ncbi:Ig-like domain repeat protein [Mumia zhuanghuii]|uniref:copper amine oxidase n=2 Tax=Mumia TaxID=1546255 RepID=UPI003640B663
MCARIHPIKGLVLEKVEFRPATGDYEYEGYKRVIDQLYLAQLNVPYDTGAIQYNDITEYGFGDEHLVEQSPELCPGEARDVTQSFMLFGELIERTMPGICVDEVGTGLATHSQERLSGGGPRFVEHGTGLEVSSVSKISWYEYQQKVTFDDHGQIDVGLGATGDVAPGAMFFPTAPEEGWPLGSATEGEQRYGASHWHNAIYRVDFGVDSGEHQRVERWDYARPPEGPSSWTVHGRGTVEDAAFSSIPGDDHNELTWWRVVNPDSLNKDGHARSYELVNRNPVDHFASVTQPLVTFTNKRDCEEYASDNLNPGCPNDSILDYVANDDAPLTDPVAWVNVGFHHVDRDEDQSPMQVHWQRFQLVPRDFFAQTPSITPERSCVNGFDEGVDTSARPCVATNQVRPSIETDRATVDTGTIMTADPGTWNTARTRWDYSYMWFRNGAPITTVGEDGVARPALGPTYVVTPADAGARVTVKVTASQVGFPSGTAESVAVQVVGRPRSTPTVGLAAPAGAYGRAGTVTVTVSNSATGTVTLTLNGRSLGAKTLSRGRALYSIPRTTTPGRWTLRASYHGNTTLNTATRTTTYTVTKARPGTVKTKITKKPSSRKKGKATITIARPTGLTAPRGKVTLVLKKGSKKLKTTATVRNGKATVKLPKTTRGTWKITTTYTGDTRYTPARSVVIRLRATSEKGLKQPTVEGRH